jgi:hypothetical protein
MERVLIKLVNFSLFHTSKTDHADMASDCCSAEARCQPWILELRDKVQYASTYMRGSSDSPLAILIVQAGCHLT